MTSLAGAALVAVPAGPASAASCSSTRGVTVVVDFASVGGGLQTRCADGDPSTGLAALRYAGFTPTRAAQQPGYFVCRIDGKPASDPCQRTSPANAYWSYWHAKRGGSWSYSDSGAASYHPPAGSVEGWAFGAGKPPSSPPPAAASAPDSSVSPRPATAAPFPAVPGTRLSPAPSTAAPAKQPNPASAPTGALPAATNMPPTAPPDPQPSPSDTPPSGAANPLAPDPSAGRAGSSGPAGPLLGALVVAALLIAASRAVVRRRRIDGA